METMGNIQNTSQAC